MRGYRRPHVSVSNVHMNDKSPPLTARRRPIFRLGPLYPHVVADVVTGGTGGGGGVTGGGGTFLVGSGSSDGIRGGTGPGGRDYCVVKEYDSGAALRGWPRCG